MKRGAFLSVLSIGLLLTACGSAESPRWAYHSFDYLPYTDRAPCDCQAIPIKGYSLVVDLDRGGEICKYAEGLCKDFDPVTRTWIPRFDGYNASTVFVVAYLEPWHKAGDSIDVSVYPLDAQTPLTGGKLLSTRLYHVWDRRHIFASTRGAVSPLGPASGFDSSSGVISGGAKAEVSFPHSCWRSLDCHESYQKLIQRAGIVAK